jgi:Spy/CpxP family protein refolding chaperone
VISRRNDGSGLAVNVTGSKLQLESRFPYRQSDKEETEMKTMVLLAVALVMVVCAVPVWSQGPPPGPGGPKGAPSTMMALMPPPAGAVDGITKALSLTTAQAASLKTILTASDTTLEPLRKAAGDATKAAHDALLASTYDAAAVADLAAKALDAEAAVIGASIQTWTSIRTTLTLTADQLTLLQTGPGAGGPPPGGPPPDGSSGTGTARRR